jgi:hypothetical protein
VTCLLTAATAALQVLAYLDGTGTPGTLDATIELRPPDHAPRLRRWTAHPGCGCGATDGGTAKDPRTTPPGDVDGTPPGGVGPRQATMGG